MKKNGERLQIELLKHQTTSKMKALTKLWAELAHPKQELASQEVKLSLVDEIEKNMDILSDDASELIDLIEEFEQHMDRVEAVYFDMKQLAQAIEGDTGELESDVERVQAAAEELGIDIPAVDQAIRVVSIADEARGRAEDIINKYNL